MRKRIDVCNDDGRSMFARRLEYALRADGISQSEFAAKLGIHKQTISGYICGTNAPNLATLLKIQKELDISVDWLLGLVD